MPTTRCACPSPTTRRVPGSLTPRAPPQVVRDILRSEGAELRERANAVEGKLHQARRHTRTLRGPATAAPRRRSRAVAQVELDSIQDYVAESDNLVALQQQIRGCDGILGKMESLLGGFQSDLGKISSEACTQADHLRVPLTRRAARRSSRCKSSRSR